MTRMLGFLNLGAAFALAGALAAGPAFAQQRGSLGSSAGGGPPLTFGFHHVAFTVPDLDASIAWYDRVLGFKILETALLNGKTRGAQLVNGSLHIELFQAPPGAGPVAAADNSKVGIKHAAFVVKDVDAFVAELKARGALVQTVIHSRTNPSADLAFVRDNSGNTLEFIQPLTGDPPF